MQIHKTGENVHTITVGKIHVTTILKMQNGGAFPFVFRQPLRPLISYSGGFKTFENAVQHVKKQIEKFIKDYESER